MAKKSPEIGLREAAELLGVSKRRVLAIVTAGLMPGRRVEFAGKNLWVVRRADVLAYRPRIQGKAGRPKNEK